MHFIPISDGDMDLQIATRYGMDCPGLEPSQVWARFFEPVLTSPGVPPILYNVQQVSFSGFKRLRRDVDHPSDLTPRLKKE